MFELKTLLENPTALVAAVGTITAWLKARLNLNGNRTVWVSFLVSGLLVLAALLSQQFPQIVDTLVMVIIGAVSAGGVVDIGKGLAKTAKANVQPVSFSPGVNQVTEDIWQSPVGQYIENLVKGLPIIGTLSAAKMVLEPLLRMMFNSLLDETDKKYIRLKVQSYLRQAGMIKNANMTTALVFVPLLVLLLFTGCQPVLNAIQGTVTTVVNTFTADGATLKYIIEETGDTQQCYALFDAGSSPSYNTVAFVEGVEPTDPNDNCEKIGDAGFSCELGEQVLHILEYGCGVNGSITYEGSRADGSGILVLPY